MAKLEDIPLAKPEIGEREEELVLEVLRSGRLSLGPVLERFERELAAWLGVDDAVAVSSGTAALHLGVRRLGWGAGDEVVTSPFSFVASANCLLYEDAKPVFCDIDPVTLNLDYDAAVDAVGENTAGFLPVDIFGYPAALPELCALADENGLGVLEDACEAPGAIDGDGVKLGSRGHLTTFAFYANKQLTTGEGGAIVPRSADEAAELRSERNQGRAIDMDWLDHDRLGFNYRMTDIQAALGIAQVEKADELLSARERVAAAYTERLKRDWRRSRRRGRPRRARPAVRRPRLRAPELVRLHGAGAEGPRPRGGDRRPRPARRRLQGVPAVHPPDAALPRAVRLFGRRVSGGRGGRRALDGAAILPLYDRGADRAGGRSGGRGTRRGGLVVSFHAETLVETPAEIASLAALRDATGETDGPMEGHTVRCFLLCNLLAEKHNADLDREVMLCACFLHDIGLYDQVSEGGVYTDEGGEFARKLGLEHGWDERRADLCATACANHHAVRSQWEQGAEVEVLRVADRIEVSGGLSRGGLSRDQVNGVFSEVSRDGFYGGLVQVVWPALRSRPLKTVRIFGR